jgi:hypothetical protein
MGPVPLVFRIPLMEGGDRDSELIGVAPDLV